MNFPFVDMAQKRFLGHLTKYSTEEEFKKASFELLKHRRECQVKRKYALFQATLKSIMNGVKND